MLLSPSAILGAATFSFAFAPAVPMVEWQAPESCPRTAFVVDAAARLLGRPLRDEDATKIFARAKVDRRHDGVFALELELRGAAGIRRRTMLARRCEALADAVALEIATGLDPLAVTGVVEDTPVLPAQRPYEGPAGLPPVPTRPAHVELEVPHHPRPRVKPRVGIAAAAVASFGLLAPAAGGVEMSLAVIGRYVRGEAGVLALPLTRLRDGAATEAGIDLSLVTATAAACATPHLGPVEIPACAGLELGQIGARGVGVSQARSAWSWWFAATTSAGVAWPLRRRLALGLSARLIVPVLRPGFAVRNLSVSYRAPSAAGALQAWIEVRLP